MEKDLEKDIKNAVEELNILIIKTKEMLTLLKETFCGDNIYLSVPDGFSVPLYKCLSYNYFLDGLTVLPLDYGCYKDGYDNIYSNIAEVEEIYNKFNNYEFPFENPELVAKDIREYIIEIESILESENKGLILALEIINSLKTAVL